MNSRSPVVAALVAALSLTLAACGGSTTTTPDNGARPAPGAGAPSDDQDSAEAAPDFSFETFEGETFSLAEQRGTPVVLNFWESW